MSCPVLLKYLGLIPCNVCNLNWFMFINYILNTNNVFYSLDWFMIYNVFSSFYLCFTHIFNPRVVGKMNIHSHYQS